MVPGTEEVGRTPLWALGLTGRRCPRAGEPEPWVPPSDDNQTGGPEVNFRALYSDYNTGHFTESTTREVCSLVFLNGGLFKCPKASPLAAQLLGEVSKGCPLRSAGGARHPGGRPWQVSGVLGSLGPRGLCARLPARAPPTSWARPSTRVSTEHPGEGTPGRLARCCHLLLLPPPLPSLPLEGKAGVWPEAHAPSPWLRSGFALTQLGSLVASGPRLLGKVLGRGVQSEPLRTGRNPCQHRPGCSRGPLP